MRTFISIFAAFVLTFTVAFLAGMLEFFGLSLFVSRMAGAAMAIGAVWLMSRFIQKKDLSTYSLTWRGWLRDSALGLAIGAGLITLMVAIMAVFGWYTVSSVQFNALVVLNGFLAMVAVSLFEELLFRNLLFSTLEAELGSWITLAITALVFGFAHTFNPNATLMSSVSIAITAGVLLGGAFMISRNLWLVFGIHAAWNFTLGSVFGIPVSGMPSQGILTPTLTGPTLWTGGAFGIEAGLLSIIVVGLVGFAFVVQAVRQNQIKPMSA